MLITYVDPFIPCKSAAALVVVVGTSIGNDLLSCVYYMIVVSVIVCVSSLEESCLKASV